MIQKKYWNILAVEGEAIVMAGCGASGQAESAASA